MSNQPTKTETTYIKFEKPNQIFEAKFCGFVQTKFGITLDFGGGQLLGMTEGLKRLFRSALKSGLAINDNCKITFLDEVNNFKNFELECKINGKSIKWNTKEYEVIPVKDALKLL